MGINFHNLLHYLDFSLNKGIMCNYWMYGSERVNKSFNQINDNNKEEKLETHVKFFSTITTLIRIINEIITKYDLKNLYEEKKKKEIKNYDLKEKETKIIKKYLENLQNFNFFKSSKLKEFNLKIGSIFQKNTHFFQIIKIIIIKNKHEYEHKIFF